MDCRQVQDAKPTDHFFELEMIVSGPNTDPNDRNRVSKAKGQSGPKMLPQIVRNSHPVNVNVPYMAQVSMIRFNFVIAPGVGLVE